MINGASSAFDVFDWRRRIHALYEAVRANDDPRAAHAEWTGARAELLRSHPASPVPAAERSSYRGPRHAPYDDAYRFVVGVDTTVAATSFETETGTDGTVRFVRVGVVELEGIGSLDVWWLASYGGGLFVPIKDAAAGRATFGGGRYVIDTAKGADLGGDRSALVIDLNFSYNPSCAYDPFWACPLAPEGNVVAVELAVGELADEHR